MSATGASAQTLERRFFSAVQQNNLDEIQAILQPLSEKEQYTFLFEPVADLEPRNRLCMVISDQARGVPLREVTLIKILDCLSPRTVYVGLKAGEEVVRGLGGSDRSININPIKMLGTYDFPNASALLKILFDRCLDREIAMSRALFWSISRNNDDFTRIVLDLGASLDRLEETDLGRTLDPLEYARAKGNDTYPVIKEVERARFAKLVAKEILALQASPANAPSSSAAAPIDARASSPVLTSFEGKTKKRKGATESVASASSSVVDPKKSEKDKKPKKRKR